MPAARRTAFATRQRVVRTTMVFASASVWADHADARISRKWFVSKVSTIPAVGQLPLISCGLILVIIVTVASERRSERGERNAATVQVYSVKLDHQVHIGHLGQGTRGINPDKAEQ